MQLFERVALGYFLAFTAAPWAAHAGRRGAWRTTTASLLMAAVVALAAASLPLTARAWLGHLYLVAGYWIPALAAAHGGGGAFEQWLVSADAGWQRRLALV